MAAPNGTARRRALRAARIAYGAALLLAPDPMLGAVGDRHPDAPARTFARVLGARQIVEAALVGFDHPARRCAGTAVDAIHAISALLFARRWPTHAHVLHANAVTAVSLAAAGALTR
jgi:hypothetical protein